MGPNPSTTALVASLADHLRSRLARSADWTAEVFEAVAALVPGPHRTIHAARRRPASGWYPEYLVDVAITDDVVDARPDDAFGYHSLLLALECEWGPSVDKLRYDFCKLADVRAALKVFVGCSSSTEAAEQFARDAQAFLAQHACVPVDEEYGVLLFSGSLLRPSAWLLTRRGCSDIPLPHSAIDAS